jgi:hypothetical protein
MSVAEKLSTVAENVPKVFEAGKDAEHKAFWDKYLSSPYWVYRFAGEGWNDATFRPNQDIVVSGNATGMFRATNIKNLKQCLESRGVVLDLSQVTNANTLFGYTTALTTLPKLDFSSLNTESPYIFFEDKALETIEEIKVSENYVPVNSHFTRCTALTHMIMTGTLANNGLNLLWSTKLDRESLLSIIGILQDKTSVGGTWTVTLGPENLAKLTDAEKAVATQKGWSLV